MVKTVLSVNHQGLRDWVVQRVSAFVLATYSIFLAAYFLIHGSVSYADWHNLFACGAMKVATILFLASLLLHAWVGLWTILTDYVYVPGLRFLFHVCVFLSLAALFIWGCQIMWGV